MTLPTPARVSCPRYSELLADATAYATPRSRPLPTWLPAPAIARPIQRTTPASGFASKTPQNFRVACAIEFRLERVLMFLLAGAGVVAIGYGFSCFIDLVQHWAVFNAGVGQLIQ